MGNELRLSAKDQELVARLVTTALFGVHALREKEFDRAVEILRIVETNDVGYDVPKWLARIEASHRLMYAPPKEDPDTEHAEGPTMDSEDLARRGLGGRR